ncbi:hypothetical protein ACFQX6_09860 [Streptosporangium lutulentum]
MIVWLVAAAAALVPLLLGGQAAERLAGADWTRRCPRAALVMWQAIGLAAEPGRSASAWWPRWRRSRRSFRTARTPSFARSSTAGGWTAWDRRTSPRWYGVSA